MTSIIIKEGFIGVPIR